MCVYSAAAVDSVMQADCVAVCSQCFPLLTSLSSRKPPHRAVCGLAVRAAPGPAALLHPGLRHGCPAPHHPVCGPHPLSALQPALPRHPGPAQAQVLDEDALFVNGVLKCIIVRHWCIINSSAPRIEPCGTLTLIPLYDGDGSTQSRAPAPLNQHYQTLWRGR